MKLHLFVIHCSFQVICTCAYFSGVENFRVSRYINYNPSLCSVLTGMHPPGMSSPMHPGIDRKRLASDPRTPSHQLKVYASSFIVQRNLFIIFVHCSLFVHLFVFFCLSLYLLLYHSHSSFLFLFLLVILVRHFYFSF